MVLTQGVIFTVACGPLKSDITHGLYQVIDRLYIVIRIKPVEWPNPEHSFSVCIKGKSNGSITLLYCT